MKTMDIWGWVTKGQDMDLAGRGSTLAMTYRGYLYRDKGTNGNHANKVVDANGVVLYNPDGTVKTTPTPWEHRRVNYVKFLNPDTGQALNPDGTTDTTNKAKIDLNGTFGGVTYSGDVKGLCIDPDGSAVVCVGEDLVRVTRAGVRTKLKTFAPNGSVSADPWRICRSGNNYFVFCWGDQRVHKVRASDFVTVATFGRSGGRLTGAYVPADFSRVSDISEDGAGGFWVSELEAPRRIAKFNGEGAQLPVTLKGVQWPEIYAGAIWVTPVTANPADPREVMVGVTSNMSILCRISFTKLTYKVIATFDRTLGLGREYYGGGENEYIWVRHNGVDYFSMRGVNKMVILRLNRQLMQLRFAASIRFQEGTVVTATNEAGTTTTTATYAGKGYSSLVFGGPGNNSLDVYAYNNSKRYSGVSTGPKGMIKVSPESINAVGNPVYNLSQAEFVFDEEQAAQKPNPDTTMRQPTIGDPNKWGVYNQPTGWLAVSSDRIVYAHVQYSGEQRGWGAGSAWSLSVSNKIHRWNRQTKAYLGSSGVTSSRVLNATHYRDLNLNTWTPQSQLTPEQLNATPPAKGLPPVGESFTIKALLPRAVRDKFFIYNSFQGGSSVNAPNMKHMVDKNGVHYRGPYENRVISPRSPYNWYYTGGTENGAGDVLDDIYSGHVLLYESNECEVMVHRISGSEFGTIATVQLLPDDDTPPANVPPSCSIALDKTTGAVNTPFKISANAADPDGSVSRVEYYAGITKLGQTTAVPHEWTWTPAATGSYAVKAIAFDNLLLSAESNAVAVTVTGISNPVPPTVSITAPATAKVGTAIALSATATNGSGTISKVEFFVNNTKIVEDATSPYSASYTFSNAGAYELSARATDSQNLTGFSNIVNITVSPADIVYPPLPVPIIMDSGAAGDTNVDGGTTPPWIFGDQVIDVSAEDTREQAFYRTERSGPHSYTFPGLDPAKYYEVRLHFCENYFATTGKRRFNVAINGNPDWSLNDFDIVANAGARFKALVKKFVVTGANAYTVRYTAGSLDTPSNSGIEIVETTGTDPNPPPSGRKKIKIAADVDFQTAAGPGILENVTIPALSAEFAAAIEDAQQEVVTTLRAGVDPAGDTLAKLYALVKSLSDILNTLGGSTVQFTELETVRTDGRRWRARLGTGETPQLVWTEILATTPKPTAPVTDDVADTFNWTNTPNITTLADYEYTTNGGVSYQNVTAKPMPVGNINAAAGQVGVRVKATSGRAASETLYNTVAFTHIIVLAPSNLTVS